MQCALQQLMIDTGRVKREIETKFFGIPKPSRGFYIVGGDGRWYLHHDGLVKDGVRADSEKPAFWDTEQEAKEFFDLWKNHLALQ